MAFLITFSVLLSSGILWMALFVWFREIDSTTLDAIAEWLSPERVSGWIESAQPAWVARGHGALWNKEEVARAAGKSHRRVVSRNMVMHRGITAADA